jgi:hypothetical protein
MHRDSDSWLMNCGRNAEAEGASVVKWS